MIQYFFTHQLAIPAKRAITNPFVQQKILEDAILNRMQVRIPPGHVGLTGLAIWWSGVQLWPTLQGSWAVGDNEQVEWQPNIEVTANGLSMAGYNLDKFPHTFYAKFWLTAKTPPTPVIISSPQAGNPQPSAIPATITTLAGALTAADLAAAAQLSLPSAADLAGVSAP